MLKFLEKNKFALVYVPLVVYWLVLLAATSFPTPDISSMGVSDKFSHFAAYLGLAVLLNLSLMIQEKYKLLKRRPASFTVLIGAVYGMLDEIHQAFIPGRSAEFLDWLADFGGLLVGVLIVYLIFVRKNRRI